MPTPNNVYPSQFESEKTSLYNPYMSEDEILKQANKIKARREKSNVYKGLVNNILNLFDSKTDNKTRELMKNQIDNILAYNDSDPEFEEHDKRINDLKKEINASQNATQTKQDNKEQNEKVMEYYYGTDKSASYDELYETLERKMKQKHQKQKSKINKTPVNDEFDADTRELIKNQLKCLQEFLDEYTDGKTHNPLNDQKIDNILDFIYSQEHQKLSNNNKLDQHIKEQSKANFEKNNDQVNKILEQYNKINARKDQTEKYKLIIDALNDDRTDPLKREQIKRQMDNILESLDTTFKRTTTLVL